jgi:HD-GYP domain-containing protein (c-di-GMP phosphodiesterase class II)
MKRQRLTAGILLSILLLLFVVGLLPLVGTSYYLVSDATAILENSQRVIQHDKAVALAKHVESFVKTQRQQVETIARTLEAVPGRGQLRTMISRMGATGALERYLDTDTPLIYIAIVDARGDGTRSGHDLPQFQESVQDAWQRGMLGESTLGEPTFVSDLQGAVLVLGEPIRDGDAVHGVVVAVVILDSLWDVTKGLSDGGAYQVYLVDTEGRMIVHSAPNELTQDGGLETQPDLSGVEIVSEFLKKNDRASETMPFTVQGTDGPVRMIGTYQRVPGDLGWGVIVDFEEAQAYIEVTEMSNRSIILVGAVAILALLLGTLFAGEITRPIRELARGAKRLAAGDYATRVPVESRNEVGLLADTFNQMGDEIQKAFEEIRSAAQTNKELFMGSIRMLANAIDEKDPYTRGHSERVAYFSKVIALHLGMAPEEVERVHLSGIIHDVGKIGIEDKILRKAAALTDDEYEMMKQHPTKGAHILEAVPLLKEMAGAGLQHHENVDGSGYPDGLRGDEIPLLGRIVSVADAFDAMTTDRPYSKAMTFDAALARLRFLVGKKFDENCVRAMELAMEAGDLSSAKARRASIAARQQPA